MALTNRSDVNPNRKFAIAGVTISYGGGDQTVEAGSLGFHCSTAGTLAVRMMGDAADVTLTLIAGTFYPYQLKTIRQTGSTAGGVILY